MLTKDDLRGITIMLRVVIGLLIVAIVLLLLIAHGVRRMNRSVYGMAHPAAQPTSSLASPSPGAPGTSQTSG